MFLSEFNLLKVEECWICSNDSRNLLVPMVSYTKELNMDTKKQESIVDTCWYCRWKTSQTTTWNVKNPLTNWINYQHQLGDRRISELSTVGIFLFPHHTLHQWFQLNPKKQLTWTPHESPQVERNFLFQTVRVSGCGFREVGGFKPCKVWGGGSCLLACRIDFPSHGHLEDMEWKGQVVKHFYISIYSQMGALCFFFFLEGWYKHILAFQTSNGIYKVTKEWQQWNIWNVRLGGSFKCLWIQPLSWKTLGSFGYGGNGGIQNKSSQALKERDSELVEDS